MKITISEVVQHKNNPVAVEFENGKSIEGLESELECKIYRNTINNERIIAAFTDKMTYSGKISNGKDLLKNYLLVVKKNTNKVSLISLDHAILKPHFKKTSDKTDSSLLKKDNTEYKVTNAELNKQFGSKKTKRATEQRERLKLDIENVKEQLENTVAAIQTDDSFLSSTQTTDNDSAYKPPINRDASTIEQVYVLDELVPPHVLKTLEKEVNIIFNSEDLEEAGLYAYCRSFIELLKLNKSEEANRKCRVFLYINYLLKFLATAAKSITRKYVLCNTSKEVNSHILDNFCLMSGNNRTRPMSMRDKSICYILVLSMLATDYKLDLEAISKDLKIGVKKLQEMSRILGFSANGPKMVTIKLPLPAPVVTSLKRKR